MHEFEIFGIGKCRLLIDGNELIDNWTSMDPGEAFFTFGSASKKGVINLQKGETFGTIESVKAVEEVYLPFSGEVISVNEGVIDNPEILQNDPIGDGWLLIIKSESNVVLDELMNSDEYKSKVVPN